MLTHPRLLSALCCTLTVCMMTACANLHPSHTLPDRQLAINGCTYNAYRIGNPRLQTEWVLRHDTACTHTAYHLDHAIYVDTLHPITTRP